LLNLHYDNPLQYELVEKWTVEWGNDPTALHFIPGTGTETGSQTFTGPFIPNASGNYVLRINIPYSEIYTYRELKYGFRILTHCRDNTISNWFAPHNSSKYVVGFECIDFLSFD